MFIPNSLKNRNIKNIAGKNFVGNSLLTTAGTRFSDRFVQDGIDSSTVVIPAPPQQIDYTLVISPTSGSNQTHFSATVVGSDGSSVPAVVTWSTSVSAMTGASIDANSGILTLPSGFTGSVTVAASQYTILHNGLLNSQIPSGACHQWRLDDPSTSTTLTDMVSGTVGTYNGLVNRGVTPGLCGDAASCVQFETGYANLGVVDPTPTPNTPYWDLEFLIAPDNITQTNVVIMGNDDAGEGPNGQGVDGNIAINPFGTGRGFKVTQFGKWVDFWVNGTHFGKGGYDYRGLEMGGLHLNTTPPYLTYFCISYVPSLESGGQAGGVTCATYWINNYGNITYYEGTASAIGTAYFYWWDVGKYAGLQWPGYLPARYPITIGRDPVTRDRYWAGKIQAFAIYSNISFAPPAYTSSGINVVGDRIDTSIWHHTQVIGIGNQTFLQGLHASVTFTV